MNNKKLYKQKSRMRSQILIMINPKIKITVKYLKKILKNQTQMNRKIQLIRYNKQKFRVIQNHLKWKLKDNHCIKKGKRNNVNHQVKLFLLKMTILFNWKYKIWKKILIINKQLFIMLIQILHMHFIKMIIEIVN